MTQKLIERTVRDWVLSNPSRGARELQRLSDAPVAHSHGTAEEIADVLICLAGRIHVAQTRAW